MDRDQPVGIFDSGVGGLTVARSIVELMPAESFRYIGDTAHVPYGPRPIAEIRKLSLQITDHLVSSGIKALVIACNAASSACLRDVRHRYDIPVIEVVMPAARRASAVTQSGRIGVIATKATVTSKAYDDALAVTPNVLTSVACPAFVGFVERGITSGRQILGVAQNYLAPLQSANVDTSFSVVLIIRYLLGLSV